MRSLLWFRGKDLRLRDHAALHAAMKSRELVPVFVLAPRYFQRGDAPPHRLQFMLEGVAELASELAARGSRLSIVDGPASRVIPQLARTLKVDRVLALRSCEPSSRRRDEAIARELRVPFELFGGETLLEPGSVLNGAGEMYRVYSAFARAALAEVPRGLQPLAAASQLPPLPEQLDVRVRELPALSSLGIARNAELLRGGARAAHARLRTFLREPVKHYERDRDRMDRAGTSRSSADLRFGTLSLRELWAALAAHGSGSDARRFRLELLWREFAHHLLWARPELLCQPFREDFVGFPWASDDAGFEAWWRGQTGYPVVDASARQLLREGFVHNRARMISASFLTKHLLISYQRGEAHYLRYLTDGDLANNNMGWQWSAGCGCDAQPYFRIFNPVTQGERFDPDGAYVRRYVPELARLPAKYIHAPWTAPHDVLKRAGVALSRNYPAPIVDHASARQRFLLVANEHLKGRRLKRK
jgi:deoxyribodipyrimidine photo-lyase